VWQVAGTRVDRFDDDFLETVVGKTARGEAATTVLRNRVSLTSSPPWRARFCACSSR